MSFEWDGRFTIGPKKERIIKVAFQAPANALPGGHYGILYLTPDVWVAEGTVTTIRQLGVIFQVNVPGKLIYDINLGEIDIETPFFSAPDPLADLIENPKDQKRWSWALNYLKTELNPFWNKPELINTADFNVGFTIPISNSGNVDVRPIGRIELFDEDGTLLRKIGKESIRSPEWLFLGEKIVDYLPINDEGWSVLPDGERMRIYSVNWKWFAYEAYENGKMVVKFQTPGEYYSALSAEWAAVLYPWEKLRISVAEKKILAKIGIEYIGEWGKVVPTEIEREIIVKYNYIDKALNWGAILAVVFILFIARLIVRRRDDRIEELEEETEELEEEIDELEHARQAAKKVLAKKKAIEESEVITKAKTPTKKVAPKSKNEGSVEKVSSPESGTPEEEKPKTPRTRKKSEASPPKNEA